jgi:beta-glucosidase
MDTYRDAARSIESRVTDLISRMTLDEKLAQMGSIFVPPLLEDGKFSARKAGELIGKGIGHISAAARSSGRSPGELAALNNEIQRFLREKTRLGIPAIVHEECLNGFRAKGATIFPQNIGLASTWEPELIKGITGVIRQQMRGAGVHQGLAPVADIARDPRWGRIEETFGEDPYLGAAMTVAYVRGLQGEDINKGVVATLKHFAGYGLPEGGLNCAPAHLPPRLLREVYLYPFEKAIKKGGALSVMNAYHEIDGIPCAASKELLTDILRGEWGFEGVVVSDYAAIAQLETNHRICGGKGEAAGLALEAGIDIELPKTDCYGGPLKRQVEEGRVPESLVDRAVERILRLKFRLGLFENPYVNEAETGKFIDTAGQRQLAREAARKSIVLLKNDGDRLPLDKNIKTIAVIGPSGDSQRNLMGDYTYPGAEGLGMMDGNDSREANTGWKGGGKADGVATPEVVGILAGIKSKVSAGTKVIYARGCEITGDSEEGFKDAVAAARQADVVIIAVGGKSGLGLDSTCGEMRDRAVLGLPGVQEKLVRAVYQTGTPVVMLLINGRPYKLGWMAEKIPAIVEAWLPGEEGGNAVADVIFGDYNPGGKLPVSFPVEEGQIPAYYGHKPTGRRSFAWGDYVETGARPLYEFGHGLSYTTFELSGLAVTPGKVAINGEVTVKVDVKNTGSRAGDEVVQLYINDVTASVTRPVKELKGFRRVHLEPGEGNTAVFRLPVRELAFYNRDMERKVEAGMFRVMVGTSAADIRLEGEFEVVAE